MSISSKPAPVDVVTTSSAVSAPARPRVSKLALATLGMLAVFAFFAFVFAPEDALQGAMQRIFYIHVPSAWVCFMAFGITFAASIGYLNNRKESWDMVAASSAEIGVVFTTVGIIAFIDVPIIYLSVNWWRTLHPQQIIVTDGGPKMPAAMLIALMVGLATFSLVYAYLMRTRLQVANLAAQLEEIES